MFRQIYEACAAVFVVQGALLLPVLILAGIAWYRQGARLGAVEAALGRDRTARAATLDSLLRALPTLAPLHCPACGGALTLDTASTTCISCRASFPPPPDYAATMSLRRRLKRLARAALLYWYVAWALTSPPVRWLLRLMVVGEPALFMVMLIGAVEYPDTWLDRLFERVGERGGMALILAAFGAFILWMIVFLMLGSLSRTLRRQLPAFPAVARAEAAETEFATCRSCGGGIHYDGRAFAALCGYCGVENYRAEHGRRERAAAEGDRIDARATLFGAMRIVEDFTGTFVVTMAILVTGFLLLVVGIAPKG